VVNKVRNRLSTLRGFPMRASTVRGRRNSAASGGFGPEQVHDVDRLWDGPFGSRSPPLQPVGDRRNDPFGSHVVHVGEGEKALEGDLALTALVRSNGGRLESTARANGDLSKGERSPRPDLPQHLTRGSREVSGSFDGSSIPGPRRGHTRWSAVFKGL
jgi:hypothetical protein